jgi:non-lysosomal glucosylceramidase
LKNGTSRRNFVRSAVAASIAAGSVIGREAKASGSGEAPPPIAHEVPLAQSRARASLTFPRVHTGYGLARVSCPLGGIGTGGIGLGGRGNLTDWQIFNRPDIGNNLEYSFPSIFVDTGNGKPFSAVVERRLLPPYDLHQEGLGAANVPGLPRFAEAKFFGSFPTSKIEFEEPTCPVKVVLDAFSPFQPLDASASGLPCAILTYRVRNPGAQAANVVLAWSIANPVNQPEGRKADEDGRKNEERTSGSMTGLYMTDPTLGQDDVMNGSFVIAALSDGKAKIETLPCWRGGSNWHVGPQHFWFEAFSKDGSLGLPFEPTEPIGCISMRKTIAPGATESFRFLLTWHFPNRTPDRCGWQAPRGKDKVVIGNYYCTQFPDAWAVAEHVLYHLPELESKTRAFVDSLLHSTLPDAVKEAASANLSTLVSNTSFRAADGSFQGFEGCGDRRGLGFGTCTHVWNYEVATQYLYPTLARSMRETSFTYVTNAAGHMDFRHKLPPSDEYAGAAAADGQMGQIVKLYFDWILYGDDEWLRKLWPTAKRALAYAWRPGGWDERKFGVMDGVQHNTYDIEYYGPNPMCSSWYLAALRASAIMADAMGDSALGAECRLMAERGSRWIDANLFNGKYYIQQIRPIPRDKIAAGLQVGMGTKDPLHPQFQVGDGCQVDQLIGQYMAQVAGLGDLLDPANIRKTLESIYRLNYKRNLSHHQSVQRAYALNDEAALVICDFSEGHLPEVPMPYYAEVMTGFEYSAAILMLAYGMVDQGVECITNIRRRYDGERANPYDETEYGRHYARAMASWAAIPILSGFRFDARKLRLEILPKAVAGHSSSEMRSFWSTPTAWGNLTLNTGEMTLSPISGTLKLHELVLPSVYRRGTIKLGGRTVVVSTASEVGQSVALRFAKPIEITATQPLQLQS